VQQEKSALLEQRKQIQAQMRAEKDELMRKFEQIQKTGRIPPDLVEKIGKDRLDSLNNTRQEHTLSPHTTINKSPDTTIALPKKKDEPKKEVKKQTISKPVVRREPDLEKIPEQSDT